jgi:Zn-dependent protease
MDNLPEKLFALILSLPAFVAALTVHEFAHAWTADRLGDDTPRRMGRVTLDPMAHLDPIGSLMFVVTRLAGWGIGWAKPVPVNPRNFKHPHRDDVLVSIAGPVSNLLQVPFWLGALYLLRVVAQSQGEPFSYETVFDVILGRGDVFAPFSIIATVLAAGVWVNILLAAFNMIPIPPLDGHWILQALFPPIRPFFESIYPFSFMILLGLSYFGILGTIIEPFFVFAIRLCASALGTPF